MFEYANGRFIHAKKILTANIYRKKVGVSEQDGSPVEEIRVAIDLDAKSKDASSVYAGPFKDEAAARQFIKDLPIVSED